MSVPQQPKVYHIVHLDRLPSIIKDNFLWCDATMSSRNDGTIIGISNIKRRRLFESTLSSHVDLHVGQCVPFYFCPRSIMLYLIYKNNHHELSYHGGQEPIVHLVADLHASINWAKQNNLRWAFTLSNAGSSYFEDRNNLSQLHEIDWNAVQSNDWQQCKEQKQAEFLLEERFPWQLIEGIGVYSEAVYRKVGQLLPREGHRPPIKVLRQWYY